MLDKMVGNVIFSKIDLKSDHHQVKVRPRMSGKQL